MVWGGGFVEWFFWGCAGGSGVGTRADGAGDGAAAPRLLVRLRLQVDPQPGGSEVYFDAILAACALSVTGAEAAAAAAAAAAASFL